MSIAAQLELIRSAIALAARAARRDPGDIELLAVSKTHPAEKIREAMAAGQVAFGENYADELEDKAIILKGTPNIRWVFIGQLQSNKIQKIVKHADEIQSVASEKHARYIERYSREAGKSGFPVWIVVNAGEEESKQGVSFEELPQLRKFIGDHCPNLKLQGVMAIPPSSYTDESWQSSGDGQIPTIYRKLREAANATGLGKLSLGMTGDMALAIASGSNCVRVGTAIFGARNVKTKT